MAAEGQFDQWDRYTAELDECRRVYNAALAKGMNREVAQLQLLLDAELAHARFANSVRDWALRQSVRENSCDIHHTGDCKPG